MRSLVGAFGLLCGAVVIWTVAGYGYASTDDPVRQFNIAFLFGVIAAGGLFGHAVSVRLWPISKFWSVLVGLACAGALIINLSNSLGALAGRNSRSAAESVNKTNTIRDDRADLARLQKSLDRLGDYPATDQEAVNAAKRALDAATTAKERECGNGDPRQRGRDCKAREADERTAADVFAKATAAKALTDRAQRIETEMFPIRQRIRVAGPVQETNVQGSAIAKLFRLPDAEAEFAATVQQFAIAGVVEALIVLALVAFELLSPKRTAKEAPRQPSWASRALGVFRRPNLPPAESAATVADAAPTVPVPAEVARKRLAAPAPTPKLVATNEGARPVGSVSKILTDVLDSAESDNRVEMAEVYRRYAAQCALENKRAVAPQQFADLLARFCDGVGIRIKATPSSGVYLVGVRLVPIDDQRRTDAS